MISASDARKLMPARNYTDFSQETKTEIGRINSAIKQRADAGGWAVDIIVPFYDVTYDMSDINYHLLENGYSVSVETHFDGHHVRISWFNYTRG